MKWISVKDRLPEEHTWILICDCIKKCVDRGIFLNGEFVLPDLEYFPRKGTTHWMSLPAPPDDN